MDIKDIYYIAGGSIGILSGLFVLYNHFNKTNDVKMESNKLASEKALKAEDNKLELIKNHIDDKFKDTNKRLDVMHDDIKDAKTISQEAKTQNAVQDVQIVEIKENIKGMGKRHNEEMADISKRVSVLEQKIT